MSIGMIGGQWAPGLDEVEAVKSLAALIGGRCGCSLLEEMLVKWGPIPNHILVFVHGCLDSLNITTWRMSFF